MPSSAIAIFWIFLRLGLTAFGGPVAHLAFFRQEFVGRRGWLSDATFTELVAVCQFLPGPASSQMGMALGLSRAGYAGAFAAWIGFTLPSAVIMISAALGLTMLGNMLPNGLLLGLKIVVVAVVAQAVWAMGRSICTDALRAGVMVAAASAALLLQGAAAQWLVILACAVVGMLVIKPKAQSAAAAFSVPVTSRHGVVWLAVFLGLLLGLPFVAIALQSGWATLFDVFYRTGALVFGGGHVLLPLLQSQLVPAGWVSNDVFLAGYGLTQAVPGPMFSFTGFVGASLSGSVVQGMPAWLVGTFTLFATFLPAFLILMAALPFWAALRESPRAQAALGGVNAGVLGLLLATLYDPVFVSAVAWPQDMALAFLAFVALVFWHLPPWLVVLLGAVIGGIWF
ncbi:MAG: chromate efflux transporter [Betaproteobacteria bacterium]|nr:chromate efflux transporter [Betaproteobacteria bacterium]